MDPSTGQHQEMSGHSLDSMLVCSKQQQQERKARPQPEQALKCPRCDSTNTKFCYYNNYSLSQPRYFCKSCRRYWTKGGTLRNVPVGGGCRKNKRSSSSSSSSKRVTPDHQPLTPTTNSLTDLHPLTYDSSDLTLAFARLQKQQSNGHQLGYDDHHLSILGNPTTSHGDILGNFGNIHHNSSAAPPPAFLDSVRAGFLDTQNSAFQHFYYGFGNGSMMGEIDDHNNGNCNGVGVSGEMMMPYGDQVTSNATTTAVTVTTMKQERETENGKMLWGFPWQINGDSNMGDLDSGRESWNSTALNSSSWHGLLNSPLM